MLVGSAVPMYLEVKHLLLLVLLFSCTCWKMGFAVSSENAPICTILATAHHSELYNLILVGLSPFAKELFIDNKSSKPDSNSEHYSSCCNSTAIHQPFLNAVKLWCESNRMNFKCVSYLQERRFCCHHPEHSQKHRNIPLLHLPLCRTACNSHCWPCMYLVWLQRRQA